MDSPKKLCLLSAIIYFMYSSTSDATCSLPQDLINTAWEYNYTNVKDNTEQSTTLNFATTTLQSSAINLDAKGTTIDDWTCINSLGISDTEAVVVFKSDNSFSDGPFAGSQWLYLCMKLTKVTTDLYYFYLLSDTFTGVTPDERVFASEEGNPPNNNDPVCSTFCRYTESPNIRTLQKPGTHDALPNGAFLCEPCSSSCKVATTEMTSTESTQKTTIPPTSTEIDTAIELTSKETTPITSQPTTFTEIDIITTIQSTDITQITSQPTTSTEVNTIITIQSTETTYIPTMHSTSTETVTTANMTSTNANKETTTPNTSTELGTTTEVESPTTSLEINPLPTSTEMDSLTETTTKETTQTTAVHSTVVDSETTQITTTQFTTKDTETTTELKILTTDLKVETTLETLVTDAKCSLPDELQSSTWEYNYTHVIDNSEQSATISTGTNTMQTSVIYDVQGTKLSRWTCINSLNISNTQDVVVFKSDNSFTSGPSGPNRWLYLCMKITKVTDDLFYFHLLSDVFTGVTPKERVFAPDSSAPSHNAPTCSTFCQYTSSPKIRTLRKQGTNDVLPNDSSLREPCNSACDVESMYRCLENTDRFDFKWNRTAGNTLVTVSCTGEYTGTVSRNCTSSGMWDEPDYTQCISKSIKNLMQQMDKLLAGDSEFPLVSTTLGNLANITKSNNELRTGDIVTASALLGDIAKYVTNDTDKISVDQLENFGSICNELLDEKYHQSWKELKDKGTSGVTALVKAVTEYTSAFHNVLDGISSITVIKENIVITVGKSSSPEITVPDRQTNDSWITDSGTEMKLKQSMCSDLTGYSCTFFRNISGLFPKYLLLNRKVLPFEGIYDVNSIIADVSIESGSCSDYSLELRFAHLLGNHSRPVCGFWDFNASNTVNGAWSSFGSLVAESGDSYTLCKYNHTTNFAILMSPGRTPSPHNFPLSMISAIGCGVSILFLVVTIVIHIVLWRYVRNDRTKALMNLCVALVLSYVIFLAGITRTENKDACTAIAVALHYMFLTDFAMMLAEGILIVRMVIIVFPTKSIVNWLLPACWVVPGIIVGISAGVTKLTGYGNRNFCWLTLESNLIWAFIGPALLVILINFVIIIITVYKMMTTKGLAKKTLEEKSRIGLKSICVILPLFGVTWVLGAFSVNEDLVMFQYLFAIFNSLQGLFICLFHCFLNKQVRQGYNHYQRRRKSNRSNTMMSTDTSNYDTHKKQQRNSNVISAHRKD